MGILNRSGLLDSAHGTTRFSQETLQEYLCARHIISNHVLPCDLDQNGDSLSWASMPVEGMVKSFYVELGGFHLLNSCD